MGIGKRGTHAPHGAMYRSKGTAHNDTQPHIAHTPHAPHHPRLATITEL